MFAIALLGCTDPPGPADPVDSGPEACEAPVITWPAPVTTLTETRVPDPRLETALAIDPATPEGFAEAEARGLGRWSIGPGEPRILRDELAPGAGAAASPRSLWLFLQQTDAQLADTESPTRLMAGDAIGATQAAARPQELWAIHALDATLRAAGQLSEAALLDFALCTGDNADNNQENELRWFTAVWDGQEVLPDAGTPGDQQDASCRDPIDAFEPVGIQVPWYLAAGNHDVLVQGNFVNDVFVDNAVGEMASGGTRDLSLPGGPIAYVTDADPARRLLERSDIAAILLESTAGSGPPGHGFTDANVTADTSDWSVVPVPGLPIRLVAVDANPVSVGDPMLTAAERDNWLLPELAAARAAGQLVVVTSHYALGGVAAEGGGTVGDLLQQWPEVVLVVAGHSHTNRILPFGPPGDPAAFWQIETSATVDWPGQSRLIELVDNGDQTLSVLTTNFNYPVPTASLAEQAYAAMLIDWQAGWESEPGAGEPSDRNTELVQVLPPEWTGGVGTPGRRSDALP
jgi:hypothetical protein